MREQMNVRIPKLTQDQVDMLCRRLGLTKVQVVIIAIDRMVRDLRYGEASDDSLLSELEAITGTAEAYPTEMGDEDGGVPDEPPGYHQL